MSIGRPDVALGVGDEALESFLDKWRARWPEWAVAEAFVPPAQRPLALAWAALQQELTDAAWGGSDARPGEAKLAWWAEELVGWSRGMRRHPLGTVLQGRASGWPMLAAALPSLAASRERPRDPDEAAASLAPLATAMARIDEELFGAATPGNGAGVVTAWLLQSRFQQVGDGHVPLSVQAVGGDGGARAAWARQLSGRPLPQGGTRVRRLWAALMQARVKQVRSTGQGDAAGGVAPWRVLWLAWRAARR